MNNSKAHTTTTILTTTLALSCSLFALTAPAATWVEAGAGREREQIVKFDSI